jgi:hypothetical protein
VILRVTCETRVLYDFPRHKVLVDLRTQATLRRLIALDVGLYVSAYNENVDSEARMLHLLHSSAGDLVSRRQTDTSN